MSDPEALDPGLAAYAEAIEAHFRARRGTEVTLSPRDFALARSYFGAGIPLAAVLLGIDRAFESDPNVSTLHFCRRRIEDLVRAGIDKVIESHEGEPTKPPRAAASRQVAEPLERPAGRPDPGPVPA